MNKGLKKRWLKALRSGQYVQGRWQLITPMGEYDEFCCLGVLADVMGVEFEEMGRTLVVVGTPYYAALPDDLARRAQLTIEEQEHLTVMNDGPSGDPKSFAKIADWIEANL